MLDSSTIWPLSSASRIICGVDLAHQPAVDEVDAVDDADRPRQHEVARDDAHAGVGHRRIGQPLRESRLHVEADLAGSFLGAFERHLVGDPHLLVVARFLAAQAQLLVDLRPAAVDDDDAHAHGVQQAQVLDQRVDAAADDHLAGNADDEGLAAKGVDVGRDPPQPGDELVVGQRCGRGGGRRGRRVLRDHWTPGREGGWDGSCADHYNFVVNPPVAAADQIVGNLSKPLLPTAPRAPRGRRCAWPEPLPGPAARSRPSCAA